MLINTTLPRFQRSFQTGLADMLDPDEVGAFILVLANSMQDPELHEALSPQLGTIFSTQRRRYARGELNAAPDDVAVFEALDASGIEDYGCWELRRTELWLLAYNPMRALRPPRASKQPFDGLQRPFNDNAFHFDKPFLRAEIIGEESFAGMPLRVMYHKFPFAPYHLLLLIEAAAHRPQYLNTDANALLWQLTETMGEQLPGIGIAYNSLGAGASINHLHAHSFLQQTPLAIEAAHWQHNGGTRPYPLPVECYTSASESSERIDELHRRDQPFNLLYRPGKCYLVVRQPQGVVALPSWAGIPAWYEVSGGFNLADRESFETLTPKQIETALSQLAPL